MVTRRRGAQMLTGMRLGDMAAALDMGHLRRQRDRDEDEREARRFAAGSRAISEILGGLNENAAVKEKGRLAQHKVSALANAGIADRAKEARTSAAKEARLGARDARDAEKHAADMRGRKIKEIMPGVTARAASAFEPAAAGDDVLGMPLGEGETPAEATRASLLADVTAQVGDEDVAALLVDQALAAVEQAKTDEEREKAKADLDALVKQKRVERLDQQIRKGNRPAKTDPTKALRNRKLELEVAQLERNATQGKPLDRATQDALAKTRSALTEVDELRALKAKIDTGPIASPLRAGLAEHRPEGDPEWAKFRAKTKSLLKTIAKAKEGGRLTDFDMKFYEEALMNPNQQDENFMAVLGMLEAELQRDLAASVEDQRRAGRDVSRFEGAAGVKIRVTNGSETFEIDPSDLAEAEAEGFKRVQ